MRVIDLKYDNKKKTVNYFYSLITDQNHVKQTTWSAYDMNVYGQHRRQCACLAAEPQSNVAATRASRSDML
jgi:hypothetical protein